MGATWVLCSAAVEEQVPSFLKGKGQGWVTSDYAMIPPSSQQRIPWNRGINGGRQQEIGHAVLGVVKTSDYKRDQMASATVDIAGKTYTVVLGPPVRLDFRGLEAEDFKAGKTITFEGVVSKRNPNELRVQTFTKGNNTIDAR